MPEGKTVIDNLPWILETMEQLSEALEKLQGKLTFEQFEDIVETSKQTGKLRPDQVRLIRQLVGRPDP